MNYAGETIILHIANFYPSLERKYRKKNWLLKNTDRNVYKICSFYANDFFSLRTSFYTYSESPSVNIVCLLLNFIQLDHLFV